MSVKISSLNTASTIDSGDDINIAGNNPLTFSDWGGGWFMQDGTYIRSLNQKSIWLGDGVLASQGGLSVGYGGVLPTAGYGIIAGSVGIGTSSPNEKLTVNGKIYANPYHPAVISGGGTPYYGANITLASDIGATAGAVRIWSRYDGSGYAAMSFERATNSQSYGQDPQLLTYAESMRISGAGSILIGTTTDAGYKLDVNGTARVSGTLTAAAGLNNTGSTSNTWAASSSEGLAIKGSAFSGAIQTITSYLDNTSITIGAGVSNKTGITINGQTSGSGSSFLVRTGGATRLTIDSSGAATFSSSVTTGGQVLVNTGTANQNTKIFGNKVGMSRTSDGAEVVYFSKNTDLGTEGTANIQGYNGIQFRTQGAESVKLTIAESGAATFSSSVTAGGVISAPATDGFANSTYASNVRNPIWRFGNAEAYGLSYFQGTSGIGGDDTIGIHFGTATAAGSTAQFNRDGSVNFSGRVSTTAWTTTGRNYCNEWIEFPNSSGLYSPINSAHFYPNTGTSYGAWAISGTRNSYGGISFNGLSNGNVILMVYETSVETGFYNQANGWQFRWTSGTLYVGKGTYGGGTQAVVLDSSNVGSYAVKLYGTINNNIDSDYGECFVTFDPIPSGTPPLSSPNIRTINVGNSYSRRTQLAFDYASDKAYFRRRTEAGWFTWREFVHSGNVDSYALPISGGTLTGSVTATDFYTAGWFRNSTSTYGLYNSANGNHLYSRAAGVWSISSYNSASGYLELWYKYYDDAGAEIKGSLAWGSEGFGLLNDQQSEYSVLCNQGAGYGGTLKGNWSSTGTFTASALIKQGGTSSQFLKADGSVDSNSYITGSYLPLTGGTLTGNLVGTTATFNGNVTLFGSGVNIATIYLNSNGNQKKWELTTGNLFRLVDTGAGGLELSSYTTTNTNFYSNIFTINTALSSAAQIILKGATEANDWYINKSDSTGFNISKNATSIYNLNASGEHRFNSTTLLLANFTNNGTTFGGTAGDYNRAYFHVTGAVGATHAMFGSTYPLLFGSNYPTIYYNMYYSGGWKIASGTSVYGGATLYHPVNGEFIWYLTATAANVDATVSPAINMRLSKDGRLSLPVTLGTGTVYSSTINSIAGTLTNTAPSDLRLKEDVKPLEYGLKEIIALDPVRFKWKDGSNNGEEQIGLIAQDVQEVMPDVVKQIAKEYDFLGLDSSAINIVLINAIKELKAEIEILKNK